MALWNSRQPNALTIPAHSAAKKDVLTPFVKALQQSKLKTGIYYSLPDWSYNNYDVFTREIKRYDIKKEPKRFQTFIDYYQGQLKEISQQFKPDLLWFDGDWEHNAQEWKAKETRDLLQQYKPNIIINSRLNGYGDYDTPEQGVPIEKPQSKYWELCYTMNDSWGYQPFDKNYKSSFMIIRTLADCLSKGGNLLLDIGPKADGTIDATQLTILKDLGRWTKKHAEAIYGTRAGIGEPHYLGLSSFSRDGKTLYLYRTNKLADDVILRGIASKVKKATVIGYPQSLQLTKQGSALSIHVPQALADKDITVLKIEFDEQPVLGKPNVDEFEQYKNEATKTAQQKIQALSYDVSTGRNPFASFSLEMNKPLPQPVAANAQIAGWVNKHIEVLSGTGKGLTEGHYAGLSALSKDKQTVYLFVEGKPTGPIALKGISNNIARIRIVGDGTILNYKMFDKLYWSAVPGIVYIDIPEQLLDKDMTVIAVLLDGPVKEYRHDVKPIESNL